MNSYGNTNRLEHLLAIRDLSRERVKEILSRAVMIKTKTKHREAYAPLKGAVMGMIFQKPSTRTRVSFEVGMHHLGGTAIYMSPQEVQMGTRESADDVSRVLSRYVDIIMARVFDHNDVVRLARSAGVPVINGLSDVEHPCQALGDFLTIREHKGERTDVKVVYVGDGNNVAVSLAYTGAELGYPMVFSSPAGYELPSAVVEECRAECAETGGSITLIQNPVEAVAGADVVYTDVWASMGQESEREERLKVFKNYQVNEDLLSRAAKGVIALHCLPAHRGEEISDGVMDGPHSAVFDQAENRLHIQKAIIDLLLKPLYNGSA